MQGTGEVAAQQLRIRGVGHQLGQHGFGVGLGDVEDVGVPGGGLGEVEAGPALTGHPSTISRAAIRRPRASSRGSTPRQAAVKPTGPAPTTSTSSVVSMCVPPFARRQCGEDSR